MKKLLYALSRLASAIALFVLVCFPKQQAEAGGVVGTGTPASCTEAALSTALAGGGAVTFNCGEGPVTIWLTGQHNIAQNTTIDGSGNITLSGDITGTTRLFYILVGGSLNLSNLTLTNGNAGLGGAIFNDGQLTIANSTLFDNNKMFDKDIPSREGGAIYNEGAATITGSILTANQASPGQAGAIYNEGTLNISNSTLSSNVADGAGAIFNNGNLSISNSSFDNNQTSGDAGAIHNSGSLTISSSTFTTNTTSSGLGGGIYNSSSMTVTASTLSSNSAGNGGGGVLNSGSVTITGSSLLSNTVATGRPGGGIYNFLSSTLTINTSTLADNSAPGGLGGGIYNSGQLALTADTLSGNAASAGMGGGINSVSPGSLTVSNSTFSGNFGGLAGGGIIASGAVTVTNSTFYLNTAGGLVNGGSAVVSAKNTIVANNTSYNCNGMISSLGHNLESANTCGFTAAGDRIDTNPLLGPLANNGGPTRTHALLLGSPAINTGTNVGCPATDQRGVPRPQSGTCDIGAFEFVIRLYLPLVFR
jgi:hypothetical protein